MEKAVKCTQNVLPDFVQVYITEKTITPEISKKKPFSPTTSCRAVVLTGHLKLTTPLTPLARIAQILSNPTSYQACDGTINFANYMNS